MKRHGSGHRPSRPGELCACGAAGHWTWLDASARGWAATCGRDLAECEPFPLAVDTTRPRADESGLSAGESRRLIRLRYTDAIEELGRI